MKGVPELIQKFWKSWARFWFESRSQSQVQAFRRAFSFFLLLFYSIRIVDVELFYGEKGFAPLSTFQYLGKLKFAWTFLEHVTSPAVLWFSHGLYLVALSCLVLGYFLQPAAILAFFLHLSFLHRNYGASYGADLISTCFLFYLAFLDHRKKPVAGDFRSSLGSVMFRLAQIQLCLIYGYSGLEKLKGALWWQGLALWDVLANSQIARFNMSWVHHFPLTIAFMTYSTLLWEIYFPALVWWPKTRRLMLVFGVCLHLGIGTLLTIPFFGALMISTYFLFLDDAEAKFIGNHSKTLINAMRRRFFRTVGVK